MAAATCLTGRAVQAAVTDPIGFYSVKVAGRPAGGPPARTYMGIQLLPQVRFAGMAVSVSGNTMSYNNPPGSVADPDRTSYLHVLTGEGRGFISDITGFAGNSVTCEADLSPWITPGTMTIIRPHPHLSDIFGANNTFGLRSGPDAASADNVVIWDADAQEELVYYFNVTRSRWERKGVEADAGKTRIPYPYGLYVVRRESSPVRIVLTGAVGFEPVLLPVRQGANVFSLPVNLSASLENLIASEGPHAILKGRNANRSDLLTFEEPSTQAQKGPFYFRSTPVNGGWREVGVNDSTQAIQALDMLSTLILRRRGPAGYVLAEGSLEPSSAGPPPVISDPFEGELPITMVFPYQINPNANITYQLERSTDLQTWGNADFEKDGNRLVFVLPPGESRSFYRLSFTSDF